MVMKLIIGLTGNIGSGKSTVARHLKNLGAWVLDTDQVARDVVMPGKPALKAIVEAFGKQVLHDDGTLNRQAVGNIIFRNSDSRKRLNSIMHPRIMQEVKETIARFQTNRGPKAPALVIEVPLLFETGMEKLMDEVWLVTVDKPVQLKRIVERDNISVEQAKHRIDSQMPQADKVKKAHRIIDNSGPPQETFNKVAELWRKLFYSFS